MKPKWSDLFWFVVICLDLKQASKPYILVSFKQHGCPVGQDVIHNPLEHQSYYVQQVIRLAVTICYTRHQIDQKDSNTLRHNSM